MSDLDSDSRYADGETIEYIKRLEAERDDYKARALLYERTNAEQAAMLNAVIAERDGLRKDAERWNTVETLWFQSGEPLELGTDDDGLAIVAFDGAECAGAVWRGNSLEEAVDHVTAAIAKVQP